MRRVCLDTSAYSKLMRGDRALATDLEESDEILVPVTVLGELHAGFEMGARQSENRERLETFLDQPGVFELNTTPNVASRYGVLVQQLRSQGTPIPTNDIWVAAAALECGARLIAYDSHFSHVPGLLIESP